MSAAASVDRKATNVEQDKAKSARMFKLIWGRMANVRKSIRLAALVFVILAIPSLSFSQLGFFGIGTLEDASVFLTLLLGPLVLGGFLFGPITAALLGLYAGVVVYAHATFIPLDFYEIYFLTIANTLFLLPVLGALASWLFGLVLRDGLAPGARFIRIVIVCVVLSILASIFMQLSIAVQYGALEFSTNIRDYLLMSYSGIAVQIALDAVLMIALCCIADAIIRRHVSRSGERKLMTLFNSWMMLIAFCVFMVTSAVTFSTTTLNAQKKANEAMVGEITYIINQIEERGAGDYSLVLEGYDAPSDGVVVITDDWGTIVATDDERYEIGASIVERIGYSDVEEYDDEILSSLSETDEMFMLQAKDGSGDLTMEPVFCSVGSYSEGYVLMLRTSDMIYGERFGTMLALTLMAAMLIAAIGFVSALLLNRVVVSRIDETNESLGKITQGDLNERVRVRDSLEFASLSTGINTTVAALKDSIEEAEQRNAQELMTAKAIQESALPREFPPFPEVDRFDIYASMKTAKEVGGDFYDFFLIDDDKLGFLIADVSGKGIPAALFMMTAKTQIKNYIEAGLPIEEAVSAANHQLCIGNDAGMFVTMIACVLNYETGVLSYVNAGHNPPLVLKGGAWEWLRSVSGLPLGLYDGISYRPLACELEVGEMLYLYTDGVTEAMDADEALFGEARLEETLYGYASMNPRSVGVGIRRAITDFTLDAEQSDDITMLIIKYGVPPEKKAVMVLDAKVDQLVHVYNFVHEELHRRSAPKSVYNPLDIAAEELFVNVCNYAYPDATPDNPGEVRISFEYEANPPSLTVEISDDGIPYNPLAKPDAVTPDKVEDVPIGGLGILMAKRSVDDMSYRREGDSNILTFTKGW